MGSLIKMPNRYSYCSYLGVTHLFVPIFVNILYFTLFQPTEFLSALLDKWIDQTDCIVDADKRKLSAMALLSLTSSNNP